MFRERCSCGAEFETDEDKAIRLLREWRRKHKCNPPATSRPDLTSTLETTTSFVEPELHIGFRPDAE